MKPVTGLATVLAGLAVSTAAASATRVVDFEGYEVGEEIGIWPDHLADGTLYGVLYARGTIGNDPTPGFDNYLDLRVVPHLGYQLFSVFPFTIDHETKYMPTLVSFDVFSDGAWETRAVNLKVTGSKTFKFHAGHVYVDNFVFEDGFRHLPEPGTWITLILGLGLAGTALRSAKANAERQPAVG